MCSAYKYEGNLSEQGVWAWEAPVRGYALTQNLCHYKTNQYDAENTGKGLSHALRRQEEEKKKNSGKVALGAEDQGTKP